MKPRLDWCTADVVEWPRLRGPGSVDFDVLNQAT